MSAFDRLGRLVVRRPVWFLAAWAIVLIVAAPLAPRVVGALRSGGFTLEDLPSAQARRLLESELGAPPSALVVVLHSTTPALAGTPAFELAAAAAVRGLAGAAHVAGIRSHLQAPSQVSSDRRTRL